VLKVLWAVGLTPAVVRQRHDEVHGAAAVDVGDGPAVLRLWRPAGAWSSLDTGADTLAALDLKPDSYLSEESLTLPARRRTRSIDVLVLDGASRAALVSTRALGRAGLGVAVAEGASVQGVPAFASRWCNFRFRLPDRSDADHYINQLLELLATFPVRVIIPPHDGSIDALRFRRTDVERHTALALMSERGLSLASDKSQTLAIAARIGIPVPSGITVTDARDLRNIARELQYPVVVKPARSWTDQSGRVGRLTCDVALNPEEAARAVDKMTKAGSQALLQHWASGRREAVSIFYADQRVWARFAQVAHRTMPALGGNSVYRESIPLPRDVTDMAERLVREMDLTGYSEVEFRRDATGRPLLMEVNPRLSASVEVAVRAGVNFPGLMYAWAAGEELKPVDGYRIGLRMRWLAGDLIQLKEVFTNQGRPDVPPRGASLRAALLATVRPAAYDYLEAGDLLPAVTAAAGMARDVANYRARKLADTCAQLVVNRPEVHKAGGVVSEVARSALGLGWRQSSDGRSPGRINHQCR